MRTDIKENIAFVRHRTTNDEINSSWRSQPPTRSHLFTNRDEFVRGEQLARKWENFRLFNMDVIAVEITERIEQSGKFREPVGGSEPPASGLNHIMSSMST